MSKIGGAIALLLTFPTTASAQSTPELVIGWLGYSDGTINQALTVRNNGLRTIHSVKIGCRFFRDEKPLPARSKLRISLRMQPATILYRSRAKFHLIRRTVTSSL
jgi:hypothetical protein